MIPLVPVIIYIMLISYILAAVCYFGGTKLKKLNNLAFFLTVTGCLTNLFVLVMRTIAVKRLPLANGYEFLLCFIWITVLMYLIYGKKSEFKNAGGLIMLIASLLLLFIVIYMPDQYKELTPLMPALKSPWLSIHVITAAIAYAGFTLAAGLSLVHLLRANQTEDIEKSIYQVVAAGFAMLSLSIVFGAIWAEQAWGSYWSWDPKETWALITWIIYALYLHLYKKREWKGKNVTILVIAGFVLVLFSFFGVNYLLMGLHSYAVEPFTKILPA